MNANCGVCNVLGETCELHVSNSQHPTQRPLAEDIELASEQLDTVAMALIHQSSGPLASMAELNELEQCLRDHAHALLRAADVLAARRLRSSARAKLAARLG